MLDLDKGGEIASNLADDNVCVSPALPDRTGNGCATEGDPFSSVQSEALDVK